MTQEKDDILQKVRREGEERDAQQRAAEAGLGYFDLLANPVQVDALRLLSEEEARRLRLAPFQLKGKELSVAVFDQSAAAVKARFKEWQDAGYQPRLFISSRASLEKAWGNYKFLSKRVEAITGKVTIEKSRVEGFFKKLPDLSKVKKEIESLDLKTFPVALVLEIILAGALANRASDIHFEVEQKAIRLRFRVDGLLHDVVPNLSKEIYEKLSSRVKLLADLKLNIHDQPQDGRFTIDLEDKKVELRVSVIPSEFGETIVIRVLDPSAIQLTLEQLGFRSDDMEIIESELKSPNGMILNTGPTGSGKTTTLYAFLLKKCSSEIKIITIEDPIEYHLEDIEQTQVDEDADYTFANGLRSIMRQDPDIILVGEVRDQDTAGTAVQASLTGHLVFSTVHANSAAGAIPRLLDLKVKSASIGPALNLVIAQRLVRRLCENCKKPSIAGPDLKKNLEKFLKKLPKRVSRENYEKFRLFKPSGCKRCGDLGYKGRVAVFELMEVGDEIEELISIKVTEAAMQKQAVKQGTVTMQEDGVLKVISGITTFEEVEAATGIIKWNSENQ